jgi:hypothetical protein
MKQSILADLKSQLKVGRIGHHACDALHQLLWRWSWVLSGTLVIHVRFPPTIRWDFPPFEPLRIRDGRLQTGATGPDSSPGTLPREAGE